MLVLRKDRIGWKQTRENHETPNRMSDLNERKECRNRIEKHNKGTMR